MYLLKPVLSMANFYNFLHCGCVGTTEIWPGPRCEQLGEGGRLQLADLHWPLPQLDSAATAAQENHLGLIE